MLNYIFVPIQQVPGITKVLSDYCKFMGGHLAEFYTSEEEKGVDQFLPKSLNYWIGLTYSGSWKWQEKNETPNYKNWKSNQPDNRR